MPRSTTRRRRRSGDDRPASMPPFHANDTPPWFPPAYTCPESAVRYHQTPRPNLCLSHPLHLTSEPLCLAGSDARTLTSPYPEPIASLTCATHGEQLLEHKLDAGLPPLDEGRGLVDTHNDADGVYLVNCHRSSYSTVLDDNHEASPMEKAQTEAQLELALMQLKKAQQLPKLHHLQDNPKLHPTNLAPPSIPAQESVICQRNREEWLRDLKHRTVMRQIKYHIKSGGSLTFERMITDSCVIQCAHADCVPPERLVGVGNFYISFNTAGEIENVTNYCLACLEQLWNGDGMQMPLEDPTVFPRKVRSEPRLNIRPDAYGINLDGAVDISIERRDSALEVLNFEKSASGCSSPHTRACNQRLHPSHQTTLSKCEAVLVDGAQGQGKNLPDHLEDSEPCLAEQLATLRERSADPMSRADLKRTSSSPSSISEDATSTEPTEVRTVLARPASQSSTDSNGDWRRPPTRFQHLAEFIQPGTSITERDKAVLDTWKAASKEQLSWEAHQERAQLLRRKFAGLLSEEEEEDERLYAASCHQNVTANKLDEAPMFVTRASDIHNVSNEADCAPESGAKATGMTMKDCFGMNLSSVLAMNRDLSDRGGKRDMRT